MSFNGAVLTAHLFPEAKEYAEKNVVIRIRAL